MPDCRAHSCQSIMTSTDTRMAACCNHNMSHRSRTTLRRIRKHAGEHMHLQPYSQAALVSASRARCHLISPPRVCGSVCVSARGWARWHLCRASASPVGSLQQKKQEGDASCQDLRAHMAIRCINFQPHAFVYYTVGLAHMHVHAILAIVGMLSRCEQA